MSANANEILPERAKEMSRAFAKEPLPEYAKDHEREDPESAHAFSGHVRNSLTTARNAGSGARSPST